MPDSGAAETLDRGLAALSLDSRGTLRDGLLAYLALLQRWNAKYNLTAIRDPVQMVIRHFFDCLAIAPWLPSGASRLVDVGTGAGFPGVPLALLNPRQHYDLLDSNGKKTRFLFQVKTALGLDNMSVRHIRAEAWTPPRPYDVVLSRAFASLADMVGCSAHLCGSEGCFLAMKGARPAAELAAVETLCEVQGVFQVEVWGLDEERHLVQLGPAHTYERTEQ